MSGGQEQNVFPEWRSFLGTSSDKETEGFIKKVVKRSGDIADYDRTKIERAIGKALAATCSHPDPDKAGALTDLVEERLRVLLAAQKAISKYGKMKITHVNDPIQEIFGLTGFSDFLIID